MGSELIGLSILWAILIPAAGALVLSQLGRWPNLRETVTLTAGGALFIDVSGLSANSDAYNFGAILGMGSLMSLAANPAGAAAVLTPLAPDIAAATGWPLKTAMLSQVTSFMVILLPYQVAPVLTAMLLGQVNFGRTVRMCLAYTAIYVVVITPLNFLWWRWLGMFGSG